MKEIDELSECRCLWQCLLLVVSVLVICVTLLPFTFVKTAGEYASNFKQAFNWRLDSQAPQHAAVCYLIGVLAVLSLGRLKPITAVLYCIPGLAMAWLGFELIQVAVPIRHASVADLLVHVAASSVGVISAAFACQFVAARIVIHRAGQMAVCLLFLGLAWGFAWFNISGHIGTAFNNWDNTFPLIIGNELTGNRPWRGEVSELAIYPVCLSAEQVRGLVRTSPNGQNGLHLRQQLGTVVLYLFNEAGGAVVYDRADVGEPLDLHIEGPHDPQWVADKGLRFLKAGIARTVSPASIVALAAQRLNEISVEVVCEPADMEQEGPARIVSMSINPLERNFTLAQEGDDLVFRLRTPVTGLNGTGKLAPRWSSALSKSRLQHLIVTYANGQLRLFVDGFERRPSVFLYSARVRLGIDNPASDLVAALLVFFLLGVLVTVSWPWLRLVQAIVVSLLTGVLPWAVSVIVCAIMFNRPLRWESVGFALVAFALGIVFGLWPKLP